MSERLNLLGAFVPFGFSAVKQVISSNRPEANYFLFQSACSRPFSIRFFEPSPDYGSSNVNEFTQAFSNYFSEEEIFILGNSVVWSAGGVLKKSFTFDFPVIQAIFVNFEHSTDKNVLDSYKPHTNVLALKDLCVLHAGGISVFTADGKNYSVATSCDIEQIWPLPTGILLCKSLSSQHNVSDEKSAIFYSLLHPLQNICPIAISSPPSDLQRGDFSGSNAFDNNSIITNPNLRILFTSIDVPLLITYNTLTYSHSIWLIKRINRASPSPVSATEDNDASNNTEIHQMYKSFLANFSEEKEDVKSEQENATPIDFYLEHLYVEESDESRNVSNTPSRLCGKSQNCDSAPFSRIRTTSNFCKSLNPASNIFLIATYEADLVLGLVFHEAQKVEFYRFNHQVSSSEDLNEEDLMTPSISPFFSLPCLSSIPIQTMNPISIRIASKDISLNSTYLVLGLDYRIYLYSLDQRVCECILPAELPEAEKKSLSEFLHLTPERGNKDDKGSNSPMDRVSRLKSDLMVPDMNHATSNSLMSANEQTPPIHGAKKMSTAESVAISKSPPVREGSSNHKMSFIFFFPIDSNNKFSHRALQSDVPSDENSKSSMVVVDILQPVSNRFNLLFCDGSIYRVSLKVIPDDPLVQDCIKVAMCILPNNIFILFLSDFLSFKNSDLLNKLTEWQQFSLYVYALASIRIPVFERENSAWMFLLNSDTHLQYKNDLIFRPYPLDESHYSPFSWIRYLDVDGQSLSDFVDQWSANTQIFTLRIFSSQLMHGFHLLCEDYRLYSLTVVNCERLTKLLLEVCASLKWKKYETYYLKTLKIPCRSVDYHECSSSCSMRPLLPNPPVLFKWFSRCISGKLESFFTLKGPNSPCELTRKLCRIYHIISFGSPSNFPPDVAECLENGNYGQFEMGLSLNKTPRSSPIKSAKYGFDNKSSWIDRARLAVMAIQEEFNHLEILNVLVPGVALPLREVIYISRYFPPISWNPSYYLLIGRNDLAWQHYSTFYVEFLASNTFPDDDLKHSDENPDFSFDTTANASNDQKSQFDGLEITSTVSLMRFSRDDRLSEVKRLLRSSNPVVFKSDLLSSSASPLVNQQLILYLKLQRQFAMTVGRGLFVLSSDFDCLQSPPLILTNSVPIPELSISGYDLSISSTICLEESYSSESNLAWPIFHNSVAAGLRLGPALSQKSSINSSWIQYNRPKNGLNSSHAGLLLALGLQGYLHDLELTTVYDYLRFSHSLSTSSILLGLAVSAYGSQSTKVTKLIGVHFPPLGPASGPTFHDLPSSILASAVLSLGLVYAETNNRRSVEVLLTQLGSFHPENPNRENFSLSCGLALGWICLGRGNDLKGLYDLDIPSRLFAYLEGGENKLNYLSDLAHQEAIDASLIRQVGGKIQLLSHASEVKGKLDFFSLGATMKDDESSSNQGIIRESAGINVELTGAGSILAFAMIWLKTNDHLIASRVTIPDTPFLLDYIRPDMQILRTLAKNLILWDRIEPSMKYWRSQVPEASWVLGNRMIGGDSITWDEKLETLRTTYFCASAGAIMAIGLKYAGTACKPAFRICQRAVETFLGLYKLYTQRSVSPTIEMCLSQIVLAWALVMAGTGNLVVFKVLRKLRKSSTQESVYGFYMWVGMAIGLLFLGAGRYTIQNSNKAIGALLSSLFPIWPSSVTDDRYHLQLFRHLYILACEYRCLETREVDELNPCFVPLDIWISPPDGLEKKINLVTPALLPPIEWIVKIKLNSQRYWRISLIPGTHQMHEKILKEQHYLLVQRKAAYLPFWQDPNLSRSLLSITTCQLFSKDDDVKGSLSQLLKEKVDSKLQDKIEDTHELYLRRQSLWMGFANDLITRTFITNFCCRKNSRLEEALLYECLTHDKMEILSMLLDLNDLLSSNADWSWNQIWSTKLILDFYMNNLREDHGHFHRPKINIDSIVKPLLPQTLVQMIRVIFENQHTNSTA